MATTAPVCDFGWQAPDFRLPGTDGRLWSLADVQGPKGVVVVFICNHCPYVKAILPRLIRDARDLAALGVATVAISSNDAESYPEDSFDRMRSVARDMAFPFPYLHDESQAVAKAYGAVCTPDFFGFDGTRGLQYRGRLDSSGRSPGPEDTPRELFQAMSQVAATGRGPSQQTPSIGCSIKWKAT